MSAIKRLRLSVSSCGSLCMDQLYVARQGTCLSINSHQPLNWDIPVKDSPITGVGGEDPEVAKSQRRAVFLEHERTGGSFAKPAGGSAGRLEFLILVELHTVEGN